MPFATSEVIQGGWSSLYGELWLIVEVEIFNKNRDYENLMSVLAVERTMHIITVGDLVNDEVVDGDDVSGDNNDIICLLYTSRCV